MRNDHRHPFRPIWALGIVFAAPGVALALDYDFYASLRIHAEAVEQDGPGADSYTGLRDAYSRIGFRASHDLSEDINAYAHLELPIDAANLAIQDPFDQSEDIRIGKIGLKGDFGNLSFGQMWLPYYNAIAYPVDMFSSYYSGFATFTAFRRGDTLAYYTPSFGGFSAAASYSKNAGATEAGGSAVDGRVQATVSYTLDGLTVSGGLDDLGGANDAKIWGGSVMWQATDALYIGAKYEEHDSDLTTGYGADGDSAVNLYAGYTLGKTTLKAMIAEVDKYGDEVFHAGVDHQLTDALKLFVEYYTEDPDPGSFVAAIADNNRGGTCSSCTGGSAIVAGLRYDFGAP